MPATPFTRQVNRATAQSARDEALEDGLKPLQRWVKNAIDLVIARFFEAPDLEFVWLEADTLDPKDRAAMNDLYVRDGIKSVDEVRAELGLAPIGVANAIYTATGAVPIGTAAGPSAPAGQPHEAPAAAATASEPPTSNAQTEVQ